MYYIGRNLRKRTRIRRKIAEMYSVREDLKVHITPALTQIPVQGPLNLDTSPRVLSRL